MTPCTDCGRHVRERDATCPFCGAAVVHATRAFVIGRVTRAAVFSAALVACGGKKDEPKPAPAGSAEHLDQDFNQLLGSAEGSAQPNAVAADASLPLDAAAAVDAGLSDEERTRQLQRAQEEQHKKQLETERQRRLEEQREQQRRLQEQQRQDWHNVAKPYGAPPARRRVV